MTGEKYSSRCALLIAGVVVFAATIGCTKSGPDIVPVSGVVTRNGKPVPYVTVYFQPTSGRPSLGNCDAEGRFKLGYTREQDGAKVDTHSVYVVHFGEAAGGPPPPDFKQIYAKYGTPELSPLKIEIKKRESNLEVKLD
jgi:hypothetical protein